MKAKPIVDQAVEFYGSETKDIKLSIVTSGLDPASARYVSNKQKLGARFGVEVEVLTPEVAELEYEGAYWSLILQANMEEKCKGLIVQLPLPKSVKRHESMLLDHVSYNKDVDGFGVGSKGMWSTTGCLDYLPCTPYGVITLLKHYVGLEALNGMNAVVIGRSNIVGKPMAEALTNLHCTTTICHSKTKDIKEYTLRADLIVVAIGSPKFLTADMVKQGAIIVDVGINVDVDGKLCGDVDYEAVKNIAGAITPVPGGVGPMTVLSLIEKTLHSGGYFGKKKQ